MIYLGADHGGFALKEKVKTWLGEWKMPFEDLGAHKLDAEDDYPQYAFAVAERVGLSDDPSAAWTKRVKGILVCRSAVGVVVAANKVPNVRAAAVYDLKCATHARTNDDVNVLGLSGDWMSDEEAKKIVKTWLDTEFSREKRHIRRLIQIGSKEESLCGGCGCREQGCC